ncbi:MAG: hypothetical protein R8K46_03580 [Mariprofundaceae bacterium]
MRFSTLWARMRRSMFLPLMFAGMLPLVAGGCGPAASGSGDGQVIIGLTDADGDFLSYTVDVLSIRLTRANGAVVETLPQSARIDFSQYTDMTEFVTAATVPTGFYTHATLTLDYGNADIQVEVGGVATQALAQDEFGNPITVLDANVRLDDRRGLFIAPGIPAHLTLDFDLDASNTVDTVAIPPLVSVAPFLLADVEPETPKVHRARGPLAHVNQAEESFTLAMRPFWGSHGDFGRLHVATGSATVYEVDGVTEQGSTGFALLAAKPLLTAVIVIGDLDMGARVFRAREVYAGSSVPGGSLDVVRGAVVARRGDVLTVHGATLIRGGGSVVRNADVAVMLGAGTTVCKQGVVGCEFSKDDISVGQRVSVFGVLTGTPPASLALDAASGRARMLITPVAGTAIVVNPGQIMMDVQRLGGRNVAIFDFTGTGSDPANYDIDTGALPLTGIAAGDPVRALGFVAPFGVAPPDFSAHTVIDVSSVRASMGVGWEPATTAPLLSSAPDTLWLDLSGAGPVHHVFRAGIATALLPAPAPVLTATVSGRGLYGIRQAHTVTMHTEFSNFVLDLGACLDGTTAMAWLRGRGGFDDATQTLTAPRAVVRLE